MFAKVGYKVKSISRTHIGKIDIGGFKPGESRRLSKVEVAYLNKATETAEKWRKIAVFLKKMFLFACKHPLILVYL